MADITIEISAKTVAWYAAIVATASVLFSGFHLWRDRARLRITVSPNMVVYPKGPPYEGTLVRTTVANCGRRPITITHVSFENADSSAPTLLVGDSVREGPRELTEGKSTSYLVRQEGLNLSQLTYVCVCDATGKVHRRKLAKVLSKRRKP